MHTRVRAHLQKTQEELADECLLVAIETAQKVGSNPTAVLKDAKAFALCRTRNSPYTVATIDAALVKTTQGEISI